MARKMKKFSAGGAQGRYDRRMADIEKDFKKDSAGKSGKALEVLEAKRAQRTADAKDDLAKRTGADRTATRAAERLAEVNLTKTRKYGAPQMVSKFEEPTATATETPKAKPQSFGAAFKEARSRLGAGKTFTFNGKSYTTNIAGEGRKASAPAAKTPAPKTPAPKTPAPKTPAPAAAAKTPAPAAPAKTPALLARNTSSDTTALLLASKKAREKKEAEERKKRIGMPAYERMAKGGSVKKEKTMKYAKGGSTSSKPPQPTAADRKADAKFRKSVKDLKVTPENAAAIGRGNRSTGMAKGGKIAPKFGAAMKKKSADTKGRAMVKKAGGGKCYASGGLVAGHKSADGIAKKGKTKGKMPTMARGGAAMMRSRDSYGGANFKKGGKC
jgi:hypothetical protein